jgi:hypothetical protein
MGTARYLGIGVPMPSIDYIHEKLHVALLSLVGPERIQDRLYNAYISSLIRLQPDDFPDSLWEEVDPREDFIGLKEAMRSGKPVDDEGTARAATNAMSDEEAKEWAETIVSICVNMMDRYYEDKP